MNSNLSSNEFFPSRCEFYVVMGGRLHQPSTLTQAFLIIIIAVHILTFPVTAALNALVMIAVKMKPHLRSHKSNIGLSLLASTDFVVGIFVQPSFIALIITVLLDDISSTTCVLQALTRAMSGIGVSTSLIHMALISGERYVAMRHPFAHFNLVTEARLLVTSVLAWLLSIIFHIGLVVYRSVFLPINNATMGLCLAFIIFCHVTVYREIRRHEKQIASQQVTVEARKQFQKDKKAFKVTFIIIVVLTLCYIPLLIHRAVLVRYQSKLSFDVLYIYFFLASLMTLLNAFFNPLIYAARLREFRVAFTEFICRTGNIAEAEQIERQISGSASNAVVSIEAGQEREGEAGQRVRQGNMNKHVNVNVKNTDVLPQREKCVA